LEEDAFAQGMKALKKQNYDLAITRFTEAIESFPGHAQAYANRGGAYVKKGNYDDALDDCNAAIHLNPKLANAYVNRSGAYLGKRDYDKAIADCDVALGLEPDSPQAYGNRGTAYFVGKKEYAKALADLRQVIRLDPLNAEGHNNLAALWATCPDGKFRDGKQALEHARKACELTKWKAPTCLDTLALACAEAGDFPQATKWEEKAIELGRDLPKATLAEYRSHLKLFGQGKPYRSQ
jgi:tetratricopeptide (TPR) repeat protein